MEEKVYTASPNLVIFFDKLHKIKQEIKEKYEKTQNKDILDIYNKLDSIIKEKVDA